MEDLNSTLNAILSDPGKMEQLRQVAQSLGINPAGAPAQPAPQPPQPPPPAAPGQGFDPAAIAGIVQNFQAAQAGAPAQPAPPPPQAAPAAQQPPPAQAAPGIDAGAFSKLGELMGAYNQPDKNVELLRSLRPHFSPARAGRIDDAIRIMQLISVWPTLRDSGLLGNLGNLFGGGNRK